MAILIAAGAAPATSLAEGQAVVEEVEEVIVTGTNIRRQGDYENPNPVQTVGMEEISNTGAVRVQDVFKGITANSGSQTSNRQNALQGVSQFSLRGLGIGSTLTLVNGRRAGLSPVSDSSGGFFTDSNAFPVNMIESIEVLTDGASATYGSEAVAGVVNIITRKNFEGFELTAETRDSTHGSSQLGAAFGKAFDNGHFSTFMNYYTQDGNFRSEIDVIREADSDNDDGIGAVFSSGTASPDRIDLAVEGTDGLYDRVLNTTINDTCVDPSRGSSNCRYPFIDQRRIIAEEDRFQLFSQFDMDLNDRLSIDAEMSFSRNEIRDAIGGAVLRGSVNQPHNGGFLVSADNPYNYIVEDGTGRIRQADDAERDMINAGTLDAEDVIVRQRPLGQAYDGSNADDITTTFDNMRVSGGLDYELGDNWFLHSNYTWSNNSYNRQQPRDYSGVLFQDAISSGAWNPFSSALLDPTGLGKDGSSNANTAEDLALFALVSNDSGEISQQVFETIISGETGWELDGGAVAVAVGAQYREIEFKFTPDGRKQAGTDGRATQVDAIPETTQDVYALFVESDLPISDAWNVALAARYEDYGENIGSTFDPKISTKYKINDNLALRASWGTSFQAPTIQHQFGAVGSAGISDPDDPSGGQFNVDILVDGSDDLTPTEATNYNIGFIWQTDDLQLSVDYWNYDYENLITLAGGDPQAIVTAIYNAAGGNPDVQSVDSLPGVSYERDDGQPDSVESRFTNQGGIVASGFDIKGVYNVGAFTFDASATYIIRYESDTFAGLDGDGDLLGSRNFNNGLGSTPDVKVNVGGTWTNDNHMVNVSARYITDYTDDQAMQTIDSQTTVDARYSYIFSGSGSSEYTLTLGAVNIFNEDPPTIEDRPIFDNEVHDPRGRQIYLSGKMSF